MNKALALLVSWALIFAQTAWSRPVYLSQKTGLECVECHDSVQRPSEERALSKGDCRECCLVAWNKASEKQKANEASKPALLSSARLYVTTFSLQALFKTFQSASPGFHSVLVGPHGSRGPPASVV